MGIVGHLPRFWGEKAKRINHHTGHYGCERLGSFEILDCDLEAREKLGRCCTVVALSLIYANHRFASADRKFGFGSFVRWCPHGTRCLSVSGPLKFGRGAHADEGVHQRVSFRDVLRNVMGGDPDARAFEANEPVIKLRQKQSDDLIEAERGMKIGFGRHE